MKKRRVKASPAGPRAGSTARRRVQHDAGSTDALHRLADACGIATSYEDEGGTLRVVSRESLRVLLGILGLPVSGSREATQRLQRLRAAPWHRLVDPVMVLRATDLPHTLSLRIPTARGEHPAYSIRCRLRGERGATTSWQVTGARLKTARKAVVEDQPYLEYAVPFPRRLPLGYYTLLVEVSGLPTPHRETSLIIVVADQAYLHPRIAGTRRAWGLTVQLYGIRSQRNWGIGDFRDLKDLIRWAGRDLGADFVGVNPLHALPPGEVSPYSPSSRLFHHYLYLDLEAIPEFRESATLRAKVASHAFQSRLAALRANPRVQYDAVGVLKRSVLEELFRTFRHRHLRLSTRRAAAFNRFVHAQGEPLERFALFRALEERFLIRTRRSNPATGGWRSWPAPYRNPDSAAVRRTASRYRHRIQFFQYLEWQCVEQLRSVEATARRVHMGIGLYKDMAVGIDPGGADAWAFQDQLVSSASIGTPPELFSPQGQRWNLAPFHPQRIRTDAYRLFADCFRRTMQGCGIVRIDHAMGLFRLFWIPEGHRPSEGSYIRYPANDLLGILALESHRARTMIIGEDLGTVTPAIRQRLMARGLLSYRLLLFEQTATGGFADPAAFPRHAAAAVATHDLPTLRGFWIGRDIALKAQLGLYTGANAVDRALGARARERQALLDALARQHLLPKGLSRRAASVPTMSHELCQAVYTYMARTPSRLLLVSLEDLLGDLDTPNLPGDHAYPSWRIKAGPAGSTLGEWKTFDHVRRMARTIRTARVVKRPNVR